MTLIEVDFRRARDVVRDGVAYRPPPHVEAGVRALLKYPFFMLGDEMGAMKSAQVIIAACMLYEAGVIDRAIVTAPADARPVWYDEDIGQLKEHLFEGLDAVVVELHSRMRGWRWGNPKASKRMEWIVTNYEYIRKRPNLELLAGYCGPRTLLVVDESSYVRTHDSKQTEACMALRWKLNGGCGRVVEMNGLGGVDEDPEDLFSQGNLLHPSILECKFITHFRNRYATMVPVLGAGGRPVTDKWNRPVKRVDRWVNLDDLERRFAPYVLRRLTRDCVDMPPELEPEHREVRLSEATWRSYREMRDEMVADLGRNGTAVTYNAATKVMRLGQITSGLVGGIEQDDAPWTPEFGEVPEGMDFIDTDPFEVPTPMAEEFLASRGEATQFISREKLDWFWDWHERMLKADPGLKVLVRCRHVPELRRLLEEAQGRLSMPVGCLSGQALLGKRQKLERQEALRLLHPATAPKGAVLVGCTSGTGSFAHNFTACHTVMNLSFDYARGKAKQADKRTDRPGQVERVTNWFLLAVGPKGQKTIDHDILASRAAKEDVARRTNGGWVTRLKRED